MTIVEPLPASGYGKANWVDYSNYWREGDAEWLMERTILRYQTAAARQTDYPTPKFGQITYNEQSISLGGGLWADRPEMWSKQHGTWVPLLMLANITSTKDDSAGVSLSHKGSVGKGVMFGPGVGTAPNAAGLVSITAPLDVMNGLLTVDGTGAMLKTGTKTVKLTTDATGLVSDSPISASALSTAGTLTAVSATLSGSLTVPNITASGTIQGGTFAGAVNGTTVNASVGGTLGGVGLNGSVATAPSGVISSGAYLRGDANMGYWSHRAAGGAISAPTVTVDPTYIRFRASNGMPWDTHAGAHTGGWVACVFTSDPGAANAPTGSILLT